MTPDPNNHLSVIALGANLPSAKGSPKATVGAAIATVFETLLTQGKASAFYATPAFPAGNGPDFVNAVVIGNYPGESLQLLQDLHAIEAAFGRKRLLRWGQRVLDLDLIAHGNRVLPDKETHRHWQELALSEQVMRAPSNLILPHPRLQDRAFVLGPMMDVAPDWLHPVSGKTCKEMWEDLPKDLRGEVKPLG